MNHFYREALKIAERKLVRGEAGDVLQSPRLGTGGKFRDTFLWDTAFCAMWARYEPARFPVENSLDNFYRLQDGDGFISRQYLPSGLSKWAKWHPVSFAPPILAWAELKLYETGMFPGRLARVYPMLARQHGFNRRFRRADGLYFSDCWGCGMDNMPRWNSPDEITDKGGICLTPEAITPTANREELFRFMVAHPKYHFSWNRQLGWCETSCQVAFNAANLARIARILGRNAEAEAWEKEHRELAEKINELCYDEETRFYYDTFGGTFVRRKHIGAFWTLVAQVAPPERAERLIGELRNPETFCRPHGVPCLAADDPDYDSENGYWCGPAWCPATYMVLCGLRRYQEEKLARDIAEKFYLATRSVFEATGTIWENYSVEQADRPTGCSGRDFCGWSALAPVTIYREFLC